MRANLNVDLGTVVKAGLGASFVGAAATILTLGSSLNHDNQLVKTLAKGAISHSKITATALLITPFTPLILRAAKASAKGIASGAIASKNFTTKAINTAVLNPIKAILLGSAITGVILLANSSQETKSEIAQNASNFLTANIDVARSAGKILLDAKSTVVQTAFDVKSSALSAFATTQRGVDYLSGLFAQAKNLYNA